MGVIQSGLNQSLITTAALVSQSPAFQEAQKEKIVKQEEKQLKDSGMSTLTVETKDTPHSSLVMSSLSETEYHYIKRDKKVDRMKIMTNNLMSITEIMNIYDFQIITETVPSKNNSAIWEDDLLKIVLRLIEEVRITFITKLLSLS